MPNNIETCNHVFYGKTDEEILEFLTKKVAEGSYDRFVAIEKIDFRGDFTKRLVFFRYTAHDPFFSGEVS